MRVVADDGLPQGSCGGFEQGFYFVMGILSVEHAEVKVAPGVFGDAVPKVAHHLRREVAYRRAREGGSGASPTDRFATVSRAAISACCARSMRSTTGSSVRA